MSACRSVALLFAMILLSACRPAIEGGIRIENASAGATPPGATVGAVYMKITAAADDALVSASTPIAASVEMHTSSEDNGMTKMRPLTVAELEAGQPFAFAPGGAHFMLIGLQEPLSAGSRFPLTLHFRNAGERMVEVTVAAPGQH